MSNPTDPTAPIEDLTELARKVGDCANILARIISDQADPERAAAILDTLTACPKNTRNCDMMFALAIAISIQARQTSEEIGVSVDTAVSIVASTLGFLAKRANVVKVPSDPTHLH